MPARLTTADEQLRVRAAAVREQFVASGTNVSEWARERDLSLKLVHQILRGERRCRRGESHRIAVALGIKDEALAPGEQSKGRSTGALGDLEAAR